MSETGRYYITDKETGRKFCVEPVGERPTEKVYTNGGIDGTGEKNKSTIKGGCVPERESIITEENGFRDIVTIGPHMSPESYIDFVIKNNISLNDTKALEIIKHNKKFLEKNDV